MILYSFCCALCFYCFCALSEFYFNKIDIFNNNFGHLLVQHRLRKIIIALQGFIQKLSNIKKITYYRIFLHHHHHYYQPENIHCLTKASLSVLHVKRELISCIYRLSYDSSDIISPRSGRSAYTKSSGPQSPFDHFPDSVAISPSSDVAYSLPLHQIFL